MVRLSYASEHCTAWIYALIVKTKHCRDIFSVIDLTSSYHPHPLFEAVESVVAFIHLTAVNLVWSVELR